MPGGGRIGDLHACSGTTTFTKQVLSRQSSNSTAGTLFRVLVSAIWALLAGGSLLIGDCDGLSRSGLLGLIC